MLATVGRRLGEIRGTDAAFRLGGDEFAVLLPETRSDAAELVARRISRQIRDDTFPHEVTATWGIAEATGPDPEELLAAADRELYARKRDTRTPTEADRVGFRPRDRGSYHRRRRGRHEGRRGAARTRRAGRAAPRRRPSTSSTDALLDQLVEAIEAVRADDTRAVGIGVPSVVDFHSGRIRYSVNIPLADVAAARRC